MMAFQTWGNWDDRIAWTVFIDTQHTHGKQVMFGEPIDFVRRGRNQLTHQIVGDAALLKTSPDAGIYPVGVKVLRINNRIAY